MIDGYNLLHSLSSRAGTARKKLSKNDLCERLAGFAAVKRIPVTLVLDGVGQDAEFQKARTRYFGVVYSQEFSADCVIERYLCQNKGRSLFTVVTNDRTVSDMATGLGARVMKNSLFKELLKESDDAVETILWNEKINSHGFHRPLDKKLKEKGFLD